MQSDLGKCVRELAHFLRVEISDERVEELCNFVSINNMKDNPSYQTRFDGAEIGIVRKGGTGGWKDVFTVRQSEFIDDVYGEKIKNLGLPVKY